jgi:FkbM family methyltransferase
MYSGIAATRRNRLKRLLGRWPRAYRASKRAELVLQWATGRVHEEDFRVFECFHEDTSLAVDVGANSGQSAISLRNVAPRMRILSFEINPALRPDLEFVSRFVPNFAFRIEALGSIQGSVPFYLPESSTIDLSQEGTTNLEFLRRRISTYDPEIVGTVSVKAFSLPATPLDSLRLQPSIVKIDVQGAEADVLEGMEETIALHLPVLLIENNLPAAAEFLRFRTYQLFTWRGDRLWREQTGGNMLALSPHSRHWPRFTSLFA